MYTCIRTYTHANSIFAKYASRGNVYVPLSTLHRQIIVIDDRKPLSVDLLNICGSLALPPKKIPSALAVRERERERELAEIAARFLHDRHNGGPEKRRRLALGAGKREKRIAFSELRKDKMNFIFRTQKEKNEFHFQTSVC